MKHYHINSRVPGYLPYSEPWATTSKEQAIGSVVEDLMQYLDYSGDEPYSYEIDGIKNLATINDAELRRLLRNMLEQDGYVYVGDTSKTYDLGMVFEFEECDEDDCEIDEVDE